tara:strand:+ start:227 stop:499 length:273 start_codon:yes stop_codon:yes gene_type:complete
MNPKLKTRSDSPVFRDWATRVDNILMQVPTVSANGHMPLEFSDDEFQSASRKLQQCALRFDDIPIYPINEVIAKKLIYDQLQEANDKSDY